ncbi:MAG: SLC13 family permease [Roseburia sp.]|nr:SLC13 family permease [Roseburia sp.]
MKKITAFIKKETVLCIAAALAFFSVFWVAPDKQYLEYIDFRTLSLLFCLMGVMSGLQNLGVFEWIAVKMLGRVKSTGALTGILIFLCFFFGMLITNDVALITFVPFTFTVLKLLGEEKRERLLVPVVAMQTIGANLGSMLTPVGNPQNLYLYDKSGMSLGAFIGLMLPYTAAAFLLLCGFCLVQGRRTPKELKILLPKQDGLGGKEKKLAVYLLLFLLALACVVRAVPYPVMLAVTVLVIFCMDREVLGRVDYSLLLTFICFFVFIGNMGRIPAFSDFLGSVVSGNEVYVAILSSQLISNVPAALLLSGFTDNFRDLVVGVDLGGLGTLIASMASLISYKYVAREASEKKKGFLMYFTLGSICFLAVLVLLYEIIA